MRKKAKIIGVSLLVIIVLLTFFSKTIYSHNLPTVTAALPRHETLTKTESTTGSAKWSDIEEIYCDAAGKVDEVLVQEGDKVKKGQVLIKLSFDTDEAKQKLLQSNIDENKLSLDIGNIRSKINRLNSSDHDYELDTIKDKIAKAEKNFSDLKSLYEINAVAKKEVIDAETELNNLKREFDNLKQKKAEELATLQNDLKAKNLDMESLEVQQKNLQDKMKVFEKTAIYATADGTITKMPVKRGQQLNSNELTASIGKGHSFEIECQVSSENDFISAGDTAELTNSDLKLKGSVSKISSDEKSKKITIKLVSEEVTDGESFDIKFKKTSKNSYILVPNSCVNKDTKNYFIYGIKRREGILGQEFYTEKVKVDIGDSNEEYTIIKNGITFLEPIVVTSNKQFTEGQTVKIENEGDFFVK